MEKSNKVLLITYYWPPSTEVGAVRVEKIARYLSNQGWTPLVLTVNAAHYGRAIQSGSNFPFRVVRTAAWPSPLKGYNLLKAFIEKLRQYKASSGELERNELAYDPDQHETKLSLVGRAKRLLLSLLYTPDEFQGWLPFAILGAISCVKTHNVRHVITSGPPFTTHLVGLAVKKWQGNRIKWIADFRDPWVANEQRPAFVTSALSESLNLFLEKKVIVHADHVVSVTPLMTDWYKKRYPDLNDQVWKTITNGFERAEYNFPPSSVQGKKFTISYVGSIEYARSPECVFKAVSELCREGIFDRRLLSIRLVGKCESVQGRPIVEIVKDHDLGGIVELIGIIPRHEALKEVMNAHVLLLLANAQRLQVPGKAYEYIAARRFILALTEEHGATADLIRRVGRGIVVHPSDHVVLKRVLQNCYEEFSRQQMSLPGTESVDSSSVLNEYEWQSLGSQYCKLLS